MFVFVFVFVFVIVFVFVQIRAWIATTGGTESSAWAMWVLMRTITDKIGMGHIQLLTKANREYVVQQVCLPPAGHNTMCAARRAGHASTWRFRNPERRVAPRH